ncbi:MAG TPA: PLP-dependent aminotransferase family protein [Rhodocyclaceae bacterium]|nr:PLP-dependent aminotransferase family protein [Rhodocyclaceae bacterium]
MKPFELSAFPGQTLVEKVVSHLAKAVESGQLAPGAKLPSIRDFAGTNGISKSTVVEAYDRLVARGLVTARSKSGFYAAARRPVLEIAKSEASADRPVDEFWMLRNSLNLPADALRPGCGWLPSAYLDESQIRRVLGALKSDRAESLTEYGHPAGCRELRVQLQRHLAEREIEAGADRILLTDSGSQGLDLGIRLLVQPGDAVVVDDPCYFNFRASLKAHRVDVLGVPLTPAGPDMEAFEKIVARHRPRLYITNSVLQNPTGISFSPSVVHQILVLTEKYDFSVIEDDTFADFDEGKATRLASLDPLGRVIYVGSFSKTLSGAIRCGFVAAKPEWIEAMTDLKLATTYGNNELSARLIYRLLADGSYRKHMESIRQRLRRLREPVKARLEACGLAPWGLPGASPFLWMEAPEGNDTSAIAQAALREGILLAPGNVFSVSNTAGRFLRFNTAHTQDPRLFEFLRSAIRG